MADSFFGFDISLSNVNERDDGGGREASEDEYDALNDETFGGSGEDGDWEQQHEELSMLSENDKHHSDLEAFLSHLVLEEYDEYTPEEEVSPVAQPPLLQPPPMQVPPPPANISQGTPQTSWLKNALSVEELERNILRQQVPQHPKQQPMNQQQYQQQPLSPMNQQHLQQMNQQPMQQLIQQQNMLLPPQLQQQHMQHQKQIQQQMQQQNMQQQNLQQQNMQQQNMQQQNMSQQNMQPQNMQQQNMQQQNIQQQIQHPQMQQHPHMPMLMPFFQNRFPTNMMPPQGPPSMMGPRSHFLPGPNQPLHPFNNFNQMPPNKMPVNILQRPPPPGVSNLQAIEKQQQQTNMHHHQINSIQPMNSNIPPPINTIPPPINAIPPPINNLQQPVNNVQQQIHNMNQPTMSNQQMIGNMINSINNQSMNKLNNPNLQSKGPQIPNNLNQHPNMMNQNQNLPSILQSNQMMNQKNVQHNRLNQSAGFKHQQGLNQNSNQKKANGSRNPGGFLEFSQEEVMQLIQETHPLLQKINMAKPMYRKPKTLDEIMGSSNQGLRKGDGDQYSGLMSQREKQWLLNIQLMQLNTGTPYIDDYYYTVFLDRQAKKEKQQELKEAHKANQQNHPFSQQNLTNNRYGNNTNSGEGGRERRNSSRSIGDSNNSTKDGPRTYVPTQFENSLGKLQCGSVTAPRKIIDMEVVSGESGGPEAGSSGTAPSTRGSRQTLLTIESLYRILLRVEDLSQPLAIATALVLREREEKQKALLLEQQQNALEDEVSSSPPNSDSANHFLRGIESVVTKQQQNSKEVIGSASTSTSLSISAPNLLDENKTDLLGKLMSSLLYEDRLNHILMFRKGKSLVVRILSQATPIEWWRAPLGRLWPRLLKCLPAACRRDSHYLAPLTAHARSYLNGTEGWAPVSDLCQILSEGAQLPGPSPHPLRSTTPALLQRGLMAFMLTTQLGLSLVVVLFERATALGRPVPAAWSCLVRAAARQALQNPTATALPARPTTLLQRQALAQHAQHASLSQQEEEALSELLC